MKSTVRTQVAGLSTPAHPLCFPGSLSFQRHSVTLRSSAWPQEIRTSNAAHGTGNESHEAGGSALAFPHTNPADMIIFMYERQRIVDVLNEYTYTLDSCMIDLAVAETWASLFTEDCHVAYPFGTHSGREGLAKFGMETESRFKRMQHLQTNHTVDFESSHVAHVRCTCFCTHGLHDEDLSQHFMEGGYYYITMRREKRSLGDCWKIASLTLDIAWTMGDGMGANTWRTG